MLILAFRLRLPLTVAKWSNLFISLHIRFSPVRCGLIDRIPFPESRRKLQWNNDVRTLYSIFRMFPTWNVIPPVFILIIICKIWGFDVLKSYLWLWYPKCIYFSPVRNCGIKIKTNKTKNKQHINKGPLLKLQRKEAENDWRGKWLFLPPGILQSDLVIGTIRLRLGKTASLLSRLLKGVHFRPCHTHWESLLLSDKD